jgi:hypothetical protein
MNHFPDVTNYANPAIMLYGKNMSKFFLNARKWVTESLEKNQQIFKMTCNQAQATCKVTKIGK